MAYTEEQLRSAALLEDAIRYLDQRYTSMEDAGLPISMAAKMDGQLPLPSSNKAPQEVRVTVRPGFEQRYHTQYTPEVNPATGQVDIVPYIDPVTGSAMVTNLGEGVPMDGYTKASEYVQQQVGRLAGSKVVANHNDNVYAPDFKTAEGLVFDGETTRPSWRKAGDAIQMYTNIVDKSNPTQPAKYMAPAIKRVMESTIARNPNADVNDVMGILSNRLGGQQYGGKGLDESKEAVMLTVLSDEDHQYNKINKDVKAVPIQGALWQNLDRFREIMPTITGRELSQGLQVRPNYGNSQGGHSRGRVYITPKRSTRAKYTTDLRQVSPLVEQLFDYVQ